MKSAVPSPNSKKYFYSYSNILLSYCQHQKITPFLASKLPKLHLTAPSNAIL